MAVNQQSRAVQRNASLRRIAIVISSLPSETAAKLMQQMSNSGRNELRRAIASLADVDPLERQRAVRSFTQSVRRSSLSVGEASTSAEATDREAPDELEVGSGRPSDSSPVGSDTNFDFLAEISSDDLAEILKSELPQTVAIVMASIRPTQAAKVLPRFDKAMRMDAIHRIGSLGDLPEESLEAVAMHLRHRVERYSESRKKTSGRRALDAILAELPQQGSSSTGEGEPHSASGAISESAAASAIHRPGGELERVERLDPGAATAATVDERFNAAVSAVHQTASRPRLKSHHRGAAGESEGVSERTSLRIAPSTRIAVERPSIESMSTDAIHELLIGLEPADLCDALGKVETRTAILAICGLPPHVSDAALGELPRSAARDVRRQLASVGAMELREIDEAKQRVAATIIPSRPRSEESREFAVGGGVATPEAIDRVLQSDLRPGRVGAAA